MSGSIIYSSKYNINSFNELTLEEYKDTIEISLWHKASSLFHREKYYIKGKIEKLNKEKVVELYNSNDYPQSEFEKQFEDTCLYWYATSMRDNNHYCANELSYISEGDFNCGAFISEYTFSHKDNRFSFDIRYNGRSADYFINKLKSLLNKQLTVNELMNCFWRVTNTSVTLNIDTRDTNGNICGYKEVLKLNEIKDFLTTVIPSLQSRLYNLSKIHL